MKSGIAKAAILVVAAFATAFASEPPSETSRCAENVKAFVAAARKLNKAWPWQGPIPEATPVVRCGRAIAPSLVAQLKYEGEQTTDWDLHVEQQVELALCQLFGVLDESGKTVFGVRSFESENAQVKRFWQRRVQQDTSIER